MLDSIRCEDYGFKLPDLTVAVMVKSYLRWMSPEDAKVILDNIVSSHRSEYKLDGKELARLIDDAKTAAMMDTAAWQAQEGEHLLERVILYLRNESFPIIKGEKYVEELPEEFAAFITDCWNDMQA